MGRTITGAPRVWTTVMRTLVTMTGTTAVLMRTTPGTTISVRSPVVGREAPATTGVARRVVAGSIAHL